MQELETIQTTLQRKAGRRDQIASELESISVRLKTLTQEQEDISRSLEIIQVVAKLTQQELEVHISELVTLALEAVFPNPYKMVLKFETRRNRSEADLLLQDENDNLLNPMDAVGGGVVDVAAFALRIALWILKRPRPRAMIVLDEPFRFLSSDLQEKASIMLKELSKKLGIQFILVTHEEQLLSSADKVFKVVNKQGISSVVNELAYRLKQKKNKNFTEGD
jgi:DNA repair exonuclease SbcCD ATPase subunit